jgi:hypothetical protein
VTMNMHISNTENLKAPDRLFIEQLLHVDDA